MEHFFTCPYCWQTISFVLDTSIEQDCYIEDCEVCCNPIEVNVRFIENELVTFDVIKVQ